jgi:hypothetical protein
MPDEQTPKTLAPKSSLASAECKREADVNRT